MILEKIAQIFKYNCFLCVAKNCEIYLFSYREDFIKRRKNGLGYTKGYSLRFIDIIRRIYGSIDIHVDNLSGKIHDDRCKHF